jgi:hypothetical protein
VQVLKLIQKVVLPQAQLSSWTVSGNLLTLNLARSSLQEINMLAQQLNEHDLVDYCTVTTASTGKNGAADESGRVAAQVLVYLKASESEISPAKSEEDSDVVEDAANAVADAVVGAVAGDITDDLKAGKEEVEAQ